METETEYIEVPDLHGLSVRDIKNILDNLKSKIPEQYEEYLDVDCENYYNSCDLTINLCYDRPLTETEIKQKRQKIKTSKDLRYTEYLKLKKEFE